MRPLINSDIVDMLKMLWCDVFDRPLMLCDKCNNYSSIKHQGIWCSQCPGKMTPRNITIANAIKLIDDKGYYGGAGIRNSFWYKLSEIVGECPPVPHKDDKEGWNEWYKRYNEGSDWIFKNKNWIADSINKECK